MNKIKVLYFILITTLMLFVNGCNSQEALKEGNTKLSLQVSTVKEENSKLQEENKTLKDNASVKSENGNLTNDYVTTSSEKSDTKNITLQYVDDNTLKPINLVEVSIDDNKSLKDKLEIAASETSKRYFNGLPIEIKSIETTSKGQIATVNLKEDSGNSESWSRNFFQGSTGGSMTSTLLKENLLQRKYDGKWVDGIQFTYEGGIIEYQHVGELQNGYFMRK